MKKIITIFFFVLAVSACSKEEIEPSDDNELITTIKLEFKSITDPSSPIKTFIWKDLQGDGVVDSIDPIILDKNASYDMSITLLDETKKPIFDITKEIEEEGDVHLFIYQASPNGLITTTIKDLDKNGLPLGLKANTKTQYVAGTGKFSVILKHQPPVNGKAVKTGSPEGGSTDVDIVFPVTIR